MIGRAGVVAARADVAERGIDVHDRLGAVGRAGAAVGRVVPDVRLAAGVPACTMHITSCACPAAGRARARRCPVHRAARGSTGAAIEEVLRRVDAESGAARFARGAKLAGGEIATLHALAGSAARVGVDAVGDRAAGDALMPGELAMGGTRADLAVTFLLATEHALVAPIAVAPCPAVVGAREAFDTDFRKPAARPLGIRAICIDRARTRIPTTPRLAVAGSRREAPHADVPSNIALIARPAGPIRRARLFVEAHVADAARNEDADETESDEEAHPS
jgi:hypothetical protein